MQNLAKVLGLLLVAICLSFTATDKKTVIIDVGHGGHDPGNVTSGFLEKDIVLGIANKIKELSEDENIEIILTRSTDESVSLKDRTNLINSLDADLMISLHINAHRDNSKSGLEVFVSDGNKKAKESSELAEKIKSSFSTDFAYTEVKKANFAVLRNSNCPAVLVEMGFLTNQSDRDLLSSEAGQEKVAEIILEALR
ncbi:MAG: N-acetylmuramoyl-L-alanine amidase [Christiangramia sp.]|nr:N-acetylmuramoyl-L-alanine amidase [Christiangramia sp.]